MEVIEYREDAEFFQGSGIVLARWEGLLGR